jgi:hypothetical protein
MSKGMLLVILISVLRVAIVAAQSPEVLDQVAAEPRLSFGSAAYLALVSAATSGSEELSLAGAAARGAEIMEPATAPEPTEAATFGDFAYLLMEAHDVPGGVMYSLLPSPRYAAREAVYREWTARSRAPGSSISGQEALQILNRFLIWKEENL